MIIVMKVYQDMLQYVVHESSQGSDQQYQSRLQHPGIPAICP